MRMKNNVWKKMALLAFIWVFAAASCLSAYAGDFKLGYIYHQGTEGEYW